jgi:hypothetical protein
MKRRFGLCCGTVPHREEVDGKFIRKNENVD